MKPIVYDDNGTWKGYMNTLVKQIDTMFSFMETQTLLWNRTAQATVDNPLAESVLFHPSCALSLISSSFVLLLVLILV